MALLGQLRNSFLGRNEDLLSPYLPYPSIKSKLISCMGEFASPGPIMIVGGWPMAGVRTAASVKQVAPLAAGRCPQIALHDIEDRLYTGPAADLS